MTITINIDARDYADITGALERYPHQAHRAVVRAINKTLNWARSRGLRAIAATAGVPLAVLRRRRRASVLRASASTVSGRAWFGTAPVKAAYLGTPRQTRAGARVGGRMFAGAFAAQMPSGHIGVFRRRGRSRLPVAEEVVRLEAAAALAPVEAQIAERLHTVFAQELNYETRVRGA